MINCKSYSVRTCLKFATECVLESDLICGCADIDPMDEEKKPQTNADRIRAMSDEELAKFLAESATDRCAPDHYDCYPWDHCGECWLDWLRQEAQDG